jgi:hypothetical protein
MAKGFSSLGRFGSDLSFKVDPDSDDEDGEDFSEDDLSVHLEDHSLGQDYDTSSEV